mgnify:CR=1 FL=1
MYFAIIGDIIASKTISNRSEVQNHLKRILDQVNEEYKSNIRDNVFDITGLSQVEKKEMLIKQKSKWINK